MEWTTMTRPSPEDFDSEAEYNEEYQNYIDYSEDVQEEIKTEKWDELDDKCN